MLQYQLPSSLFFLNISVELVNGQAAKGVSKACMYAV